LAYNNSVRLDLVVLGVNKRMADEALDVQAYIRKFDEEKAAREKAEAKK